MAQRTLADLLLEVAAPVTRVAWPFVYTVYTVCLHTSARFTSLLLACFANVLLLGWCCDVVAFITTASILSTVLYACRFYVCHIHSPLFLLHILCFGLQIFFRK